MKTTLKRNRAFSPRTTYAIFLAALLLVLIFPNTTFAGEVGDVIVVYVFVVGIITFFALFLVLIALRWLIQLHHPHYEEASRLEISIFLVWLTIWLLFVNNYDNLLFSFGIRLTPIWVNILTYQSMGGSLADVVPLLVKFLNAFILLFYIGNYLCAVYRRKKYGTNLRGPFLSALTIITALFIPALLYLTFTVYAINTGTACNLLFFGADIWGSSARQNCIVHRERMEAIQQSAKNGIRGCCAITRDNERRNYDYNREREACFFLLDPQLGRDQIYSMFYGPEAASEKECNQAATKYLPNLNGHNE